MKKLSVALALLMVLTLFFGSSTAYAAQYSPNFEETAEAVYMINLDTGTVVFEKNADMKSNMTGLLPTDSS